MRIAITGASGLVGSALSSHLRASGHDVVPVVRAEPKTGQISWSVADRRIEPSDFTGIDAVVHLAGAGIGDHRWTDAYKEELLRSRTVGTTILSEAIASCVDGPHVLVSGSAIGFYGDRGDEVLDESSTSGEGFLAQICREWEASTAVAEAAGTRVAHIRSGIVLSKQGGALKKLLPMFKLGVGGRMGTGRQWMSWISIHDEVRAIEHLLTSKISGPVNLTAPNPVTNAGFTDALGTVLRRPTVIPVPSFGPKLLLGRELAQTLLFEGQRVLPVSLESDGFSFEHDKITATFRSILDRKRPNATDTTNDERAG